MYDQIREEARALFEEGRQDEAREILQKARLTKQKERLCLLGDEKALEMADAMIERMLSVNPTY